MTIIKKIFLIFLASILLLNTSFSYEINNKDKKILNKIYVKIDNFGDYKKRKLEEKVKNLIKKFNKNERIKFLLEEIDKYILKSLKKVEISKKIKILKNKKNIFSKEKFKVIKVIDGDTIIIDYFGKKENIRFIGIDAPENSKIRKGYVECYGKESKEFLYNLLNNKFVELEFDKSQGKRDKYDRLFAYVFLNGENVNNLLIKNGFAFEYTYNKPYKYLNLFKKSQKEALNKKLGVWSLKKCDLKLNNYSKKNIYTNKKVYSQSGKCNIKGNISYKTKKKLYHLPTCPGYKKTKININSGERWFCSEEEAIKAGWQKAGNCK